MRTRDWRRYQRQKYLEYTKGIATNYIYPITIEQLKKIAKNRKKCSCSLCQPFNLKKELIEENLKELLSVELSEIC